jgi:hypothetical protein
MPSRSVRPLVARCASPCSSGRCPSSLSAAPRGRAGPPSWNSTSSRPAAAPACCARFPAPLGALTLRLLGSLLSYALLAITAVGHCGLAAGQRFSRLPSFDPAAYWRTAITLYFYTFNSVTRACLDFFNCAALPSGRYMVALPAVRCDESSYRSLTPLVSLLLAAYAAAIPCFICYRLRETHANGYQAPQQGDLARVWSVVYGPLRSDAAWWSLAQMLARAALVAAAVFMQANDYARFAILALINVVSLVMVTHFRPNRSADDNTWELGTLFSLALLALSENTGAPDAWMAVLTLGVGGAIAVRLGVKCLRRSAKGSSDGADEAIEPFASEAFVALHGTAADSQNEPANPAARQ